jgi:hypothetical protein
MQETVKIEGGFAEVGAGAWLMGRGQPTAFFGSAVRRRRKGFFLRDRSALDLVETTGAAKCADARRPFLTHIPCAAPISAASAKVLVAPAAARTGAEVVKMIPMSLKGSLCVTVFGENWVVMATASRTARLQVADGDTLSVRPESVVAWTGNRPTGFCPKLSLWDILLPRGPRNLLLHFHGPSVVWVEGTNPPNFQTSKLPNFYRRAYGA